MNRLRLLSMNNDDICMVSLLNVSLGGLLALGLGLQRKGTADICMVFRLYEFSHGIVAS